MNPYTWQGDQPEIEVPRAEVSSVFTLLKRGGSAFILAGRGMGKSVFLRQLEAAAEESPEIRVVRFRAPPPSCRTGPASTHSANGSSSPPAACSTRES